MYNNIFTFFCSRNWTVIALNLKAFIAIIKYLGAVRTNADCPPLGFSSGRELYEFLESCLDKAIESPGSADSHGYRLVHRQCLFIDPSVEGLYPYIYILHSNAFRMQNLYIYLF